MQVRCACVCVCMRACACACVCVCVCGEEDAKEGERLPGCVVDNQGRGQIQCMGYWGRWSMEICG